MRRATELYLGLGAAASGGYFLLAGHGRGQAFLFGLVGVSAVCVTIVAVFRARPPRPLSWLLVAAALVGFVAGDAVRTSHELLGERVGSADLANMIYGATYLPLGLALLLVVRQLAGGIRREIAVDGATFALAALLLTWSHLFEPRLDSVDGLRSAAAALAHPVGDVLVLGLLGALVLAAGRLTPSGRFLVGAFGAMLVGDVSYVAGAAAPQELTDAAWLGSFLLFGAAALHPTMRRFGEPRDSPPRAPGRRLALVAAAGVAALGALTLHSLAGDVEPLVVTLGATLLTTLLVLRLALLVTQVDRLRRRAELSEGRFRMLFDAAPIGIALPPDDDPLSGHLAQTNHAFQEMLGYSGEELAQLHWRDVTFAEGATEDDALFAELVAGERQSYRIEKQYRRKDGSPVPADVHVAIARDEAGIARLAIGLSDDISERKAAEEALVESEQRFRDLLAGIEAMVWECNVGDWGYTFVSEGVEKLLGFPVEQWTSNPNFWVERLHPDDRDWMVERARAGERESRGWSVEYRLMHADGHPVWVRDVVRVVLDAAGRALRLRGVLIDITASKKAEAERDLLVEQLRQKQKLEALGQLAGGVAHDFNNLLTAITGYGELALAQVGGDGKLRANIEEIGRCADRAAALTRQLLAFGRRQMLSPRVVALNDVASGMQGLLGRVIGDTIEVRLELEEPGPRVEADPGQLEQVILNLAVNARDAMPSGGTLEIRSGLQEIAGDSFEGEPVPPGVYAALTVSDNGTGMDDEVRRRAFDPFFTTKAAGEGTGLGLSTVYGIVKQSGGHVVLHSEPGVGTRATTLLPLAAAEAATESSGSGDRAGEAGSRAHATILLVEDEPAVRAVLATFLAADGLVVLTAADGVEALEVAAAHEGHIDLMVSDVSMPRMGGLELVEALAELRPSTHVLLMSGYAESVPSDVPLIQKPFGPGALRDRVRQALVEPIAA